MSAGIFYSYGAGGLTHAALLYQPDREVEPNQRLFSLLETLASDAMVRYGACKTRKDKKGDDKPGKKTLNRTRSRHSFILKHASDVRLSEVRSHPELLEFKSFTFSAKIHKFTTRFFPQ